EDHFGHGHQIFVQLGDRLLGRAALAERRESHNVGEQHGQLPAVAAQTRLFGILDELADDPGAHIAREHGSDLLGLLFFGHELQYGYGGKDQPHRQQGIHDTDPETVRNEQVLREHDITNG